MLDFSAYRRIFPKDFKYIDKSSLYIDPFKQAQQWFQEILDQSLVDGNAMTLSTANHKGEVSSRVVLMKYFDPRGFAFFTNYNSRKGKDLKENPHASINFYWPTLNRQLTARGNVEKLSYEESLAYYQSRPQGNQLLAHASKQDQEIDSLKDVFDKIEELKKTFKDKPIPLPEHWGGYRLIPTFFEFWQGGPHRVNLRFAYSLDQKGNWDLKQLSP